MQEHAQLWSLYHKYSLKMLIATNFQIN